MSLSQWILYIWEIVTQLESIKQLYCTFDNNLNIYALNFQIIVSYSKRVTSTINYLVLILFKIQII